MQNDKNDFCHIVDLTSLIRALVLAAVPVGSFHEFEGIGKMKNDFCQVVDSTSLKALVIDISNQRQLITRG